MANNLIDRMRKGEKEAIMDGLLHSGAIYRMNAISFSAISGIKDSEIKKKIKELKNDEVVLDGYSVSDFALAALDMMKVEPYSGNKIIVKKLIDSRFDFLRQ